jgi:hypothetical protein
MIDQAPPDHYVASTVRVPRSKSWSAYVWWRITSWISRGSSLRRQSERLVGKAIDARPWWVRLWDEQPRLLTLSIVGAAIAVGMLVPWSRFPMDLPLAAQVGTLIVVAVGVLSAEVGLFVLTAAVTAVVFTGLTDPEERRRALSRYRERAFDAIATMTLVTLVLTGLGLTQLMNADVEHHDSVDWYGRIAFMFLVDVAGAGWLLIYSHHLVSTAPRERIPALVTMLRRSLGGAASRDVSATLLKAWGKHFGLQPDAEFPGGIGTGVPLINPRRTYIYDIHLGQLAAWLRRLKGELTPGVRATTGIGLNVTVLPGWPIATIAEGDAATVEGFWRAVRRRDRGPEDEFEATITEIADQAAAAGRDGRAADFERQLDALSAAYAEICRLRARAAPLQGSWLTTMLGWPPETLFRDRLAKLGPRVLASAPDFIVSRWLYFAEQLLIDTRAHFDRPLEMVFTIWIQVPVSGSGPLRSDFYWQRLNEYVTNLRMWLSRAPSASGLVALHQELRAFFMAMRWVIVSVSPGDFAPVRNVLDELGAPLRTAGRQSPPDTSSPLEETNRALQRLRETFWLGYAASMLRRKERGQIDERDALLQWEAIVRQFSTLDRLIAIWRVFGVDDPFQWDWEEGREQRKEAHAQGRRSWVGFSDSRAGTTLPTVLLAMRLIADRVIPDDVYAQGMNAELSPSIDAVVGQKDSWAPFVDRDITEAARLFKLRLQDAAHRADATAERTVDAATPNPDRVSKILNGYLESVDRDGIKVVHALQTAGLASLVQSSPDMQRVGIQFTIHKGALLPEASLWPVLAPANLGEDEDVAVLRPRSVARCHAAASVEQFIRELDIAIDTLDRRRTPATHIIIPWGWVLVDALHARGAEINIDGRLKLGSYRAIPLYRGPLPWPGRLAMVFSLDRWLSVGVSVPPMGSVHSRFTAQIRPPTDDELTSMRAKPLNSAAGLPFMGDDLEVALRNQWRVEVVEEIAVEISDQGAMECIELGFDPQHAGEAPVAAVESGPTEAPGETEKPRRRKRQVS